MKSPEGPIRFDDFRLDPANRKLLRGATPVELGGRYFDALVMLVRERGQLVTKDRLHDEVWRGVPVTDEALSQAIMALRRVLGDDAARPRYIETVPRHGYRFVGAVAPAEEPEAAPPQPPAPSPGIRIATGGLMGAVAAGCVVGLAYGSVATTGAGNGLSLVMVLICVSVLAALVSGLGIAGGVALATRSGGGQWWRPIAGAGLGGLAVGGFARLLGTDTLRLLVGSAPDHIAGAIEGLVIGLAVGATLLATQRWNGLGRHAVGIVLGAGTGAAIVLAGGTLMAGSLADMVTQFPRASLSLEWTADPLLMALSGAFEGGLFTALVAGAMAWAKEREDGQADGRGGVL